METTYTNERGLCKCGCGNSANSGRKYILGHFCRNKPSWNRGKTKETDKRVAIYAEKMKGRKPSKAAVENSAKAHKGKHLSEEHKHNIGIANTGKRRTTEQNAATSARLKGKKRTAIQKVAQSIKMIGRIPWNKGLTKATDIRVADIARKISVTSTGKIPWNIGKSPSEKTRILQSISHLGYIQSEYTIAKRMQHGGGFKRFPCTFFRRDNC